MPRNEKFNKELEMMKDSQTWVVAIVAVLETDIVEQINTDHVSSIHRHLCHPFNF